MVFMIVAADEKGGIAKEGKMPWKLPGDLAYFKKVTYGSYIIVGRKTYNTLPPLPDRKIVVITKNYIKGVETYDSLYKAINIHPNAFVIGGEQIYSQIMKFKQLDNIYRTLIHHDCQCDQFIPEINENEWQLIYSYPKSSDEKNEYDVTYQIFTRK